MRFTVRRPANAEVSPCCHRPSGGDVACSVHVGVARPGRAGFALENRLALAVLGRDVPAHRASLRRVRGRDLLDPTGGLVPQTRGEQTPTTPVDSPVQTALLSNSAQPVAPQGSRRRAGDHRARVERFRLLIVSKRRAMSVVTFSPTPCVASVSCAFSFAIANISAALDRLSRARRGSSRCCEQPSTASPLEDSSWARAAADHGRQCRRHRDTAVDTRRAAILGSRSSAAMGEAICRGSPIAGDPISHTRWDRLRQPQAHPADLGQPHTTEPAIQTLDVMRFDRDLRNPSCTPALRHRAAVRSVKKLRIAWAKSRNACRCAVCEPAASQLCSARGPRSTEHTARYSRARDVPAANAAATRRPDSTHTEHGDNAPQTPPPAQR